MHVMDAHKNNKYTICIHTCIHACTCRLLWLTYRNQQHGWAHARQLLDAGKMMGAHFHDDIYQICTL